MSCYLDSTKRFQSTPALCILIARFRASLVPLDIIASRIAFSPPESESRSIQHILPPLSAKSLTQWTVQWSLSIVFALAFPFFSSSLPWIWLRLRENKTQRKNSTRRELEEIQLNDCQFSVLEGWAMFYIRRNRSLQIIISPENKRASQFLSAVALETNEPALGWYHRGAYAPRKFFYVSSHFFLKISPADFTTKYPNEKKKANTKRESPRRKEARQTRF